MLILEVSSLIGFLTGSRPTKLLGSLGIWGLFWQRYFVVFPKSSKSSSSKGGRSMGWVCSFRSFSSGGGISASIEDAISQHGEDSTYIGSNRGVFSKI
jgi:hypothetical protein